jgi:hypothetical protein
MENGLPGEELLQEDIIIQTPIKEGIIEFDLSAVPISVSDSEIFAGIEFLKYYLKNSLPGKKHNYVVYMDNEPGKFRSFHKWYSNTGWVYGKGHSFQ